ncbi:hypothetical protein ABZ721_18860 [Streptomyces sp. NPDC006733]|uniref:hypothetical protein n=1 Tax=Streptomyces sp. NPDC006733 TaxID=3155460 RepID=UPI0033F23457
MTMTNILAAIGGISIVLNAAARIPGAAAAVLRALGETVCAWKDLRAGSVGRPSSDDGE